MDDLWSKVFDVDQKRMIRFRALFEKTVLPPIPPRLLSRGIFTIMHHCGNPVSLPGLQTTAPVVDDSGCHAPTNERGDSG
jgi:hypothetical protein